MKYRITILLFVFLWIRCNTKQDERDKYIADNFDCTRGQMTRAWYTMGQEESIPSISELPEGFIILIDSTQKATNFISFHEEFAREMSVSLDTTDIYLNDDWEKLSTKQKLKKINQERNSYKTQADSTHFVNNQGQQQVWIINNSTDTVTIQMQDWSYICVLQAKAESGSWYPIQYWRFSRCGNSYHFKHFPPRRANSFITTLPVKGNYATKLRYKLLGADRFYYSNEFEGKIDYCEFVEDSTNTDNRIGTPRPHYKLDSLIHLAWEQ